MYVCLEVCKWNRNDSAIVICGFIWINRSCLKALSSIMRTQMSLVSNHINEYMNIHFINELVYLNSMDRADVWQLNNHRMQVYSLSLSYFLNTFKNSSDVSFFLPDHADTNGLRFVRVSFLSEDMAAPLVVWRRQSGIENAPETLCFVWYMLDYRTC